MSNDELTIQTENSGKLIVALNSQIDALQEDLNEARHKLEK